MGSSGLDEPVIIVPYDAAWPRQFEVERAVLELALAPWLVDGSIVHIGSTAVPGLAAKPVIDIMAGVRSLAESRACIEVLAPLGYCYAPYAADVEHWFCKPSPSRRTHHLHVIERGHPEFARRLAFRDHLRTHPDAAAEYAALKRRLAVAFRTDRDAYTEAKADFVRAVLARSP